MEKVHSPSQPETAIHHFSHHHPLQLLNYQPQQTLNLALCSCCKLKVSSGWIYSCTTCNYFLHMSCSKMPQQITHPIDQKHTLFLLPNPICIYPEGFFSCDACGKQSNGFSYHCGSCNIDLHPICSTMPLTLTHQSHHHHHHDLNLTFSSPYHNKKFSCDICKNMGSKEWLYRCNTCEFDAHLVCATTKARAPTQQAHHYQVQQQQQHQAPPPPSVTSYNNNYLQVPGTGYLHNGVQSNYSYINQANNPIPGVAGRSLQQSGLSNQQVLRLLANATIPGLGLLMQGLSGGGGSGNGNGNGNGNGSLSSFNVDSSGIDFGAMGGLDFGGFGGLL